MVRRYRYALVIALLLILGFPLLLLSVSVTSTDPSATAGCRYLRLITETLVECAEPVVFAPAPVATPESRPSSTTAVSPTQPPAPLPVATTTPTSTPSTSPSNTAQPSRGAAVGQPAREFTYVPVGVSEDRLAQALGEVYRYVDSTTKAAAGSRTVDAVLIELTDRVDDIEDRPAGFRRTSTQLDDGEIENVTLSGTTELPDLVTGSVTYIADGALATDALFGYDSVGLRIGTTTSRAALTVAGGVYLAESTPTDPDSTLYNQGGVLYWDGAAVAGATTSPWLELSGNTYRTSGRVGIGTTSPTDTLTVVGDARITGSLIDSTDSAGTSGFVLLTTGVGTRWVATSSLGITQTGGAVALNDLTDVTLTGPAVGQLLSFNGSEWVNVATSTLGITVNLASQTFAGTSTFETVIATSSLAVGATTTSSSSVLVIGSQSTSTPAVELRSKRGQINDRDVLNGLKFFSNNANLAAPGLQVAALVARATQNHNSSQLGTELAFSVTRNNGNAPFEAVYINNRGSLSVGSSSPRAKLTVRGRDDDDDDLVSVASSSDEEYFTIGRNGRVGVGTSSPTARLSVAGDLRVTGAVRDGSNNGGTSGMVLQSTGAGIQWVATSSLGLGGGGGGATTFLALTDTPSSYTAGRIFYANASATAVTDSSLFTFTGTNVNLGTNTGLSFGGTRMIYGSSSAGFYGNLMLGTGAGSSLYIATSSNENNVLIGPYAGETGTSSSFANRYNIFIGEYAGWENGGDRNIGIGSNAGGENWGYDNLFLGANAGYVNGGDDSVLIGINAGYRNSGFSVIALGEDAGRNNTENDSIFIGAAAGYNNRGYNSYFIGDGAGYSNTGDENAFFGLYAAEQNTGRYNTGMGIDAGRYNQGEYNLFVGYEAGQYNLGTSSVFVGRRAGENNRGTQNNFIGDGAGQNNWGSYNEFLGAVAGYNNRGDYNQFVGYDAGYWYRGTSSVIIGASAYRGGLSTFTSANNVVVGYRAGAVVETGATNNILLGYQAADTLTTGANNIVIGYDIDTQSTTQSNTLNIGNLLFGTGLTATGTTIASGNIGIGTSSPSASLTVVGSVRFANLTGGDLTTDALGNLSVSSDERLKDIVGQYEPGLAAIANLEPITYRWNEQSGMEMGGVYAGFSAQNVQAALPEAVGQDERGFLTLSIRPIVAALVNAVQELYATLTRHDEAIEELQRDNAALEARIRELEASGGAVKPEPRAEETMPAVPTEPPVADEPPPAQAETVTEVITNENLPAETTTNEPEEPASESGEIIQSETNE